MHEGPFRETEGASCLLTVRYHRAQERALLPRVVRLRVQRTIAEVRERLALLGHLAHEVVVAARPGGRIEAVGWALRAVRVRASFALVRDRRALECRARPLSGGVALAGVAVDAEPVT